MTPEEKRELLLKRILAGLVIVTVYFTFVSHSIMDKAEKAEADVKALLGQGISYDSMPGLYEQQNRVSAEIEQLKREQTQFDEELKKQLGFLRDEHYVNRLTDHISRVFSESKLRIKDDRKGGHDIGDLVPPTVWEVIAKTSPSNEKTKVNGWRLRFSGPYLEVYRVLDALAHDPTPLVPLHLTMNASAEAGGDPDWTLVVWTEMVPAKAKQ